jgi:hypothetical protein
MFEEATIYMSALKCNDSSAHVALDLHAGGLQRGNLQHG